MIIRWAGLIESGLTGQRFRNHS